MCKNSLSTSLSDVAILFVPIMILDCSIIKAHIDSNKYHFRYFTNVPQSFYSDILYTCNMYFTAGKVQLSNKM